MYQYKTEIAELHGKYHVQTLLLWQGSKGEDYIAGDVFVVAADDLAETGEHEQIIDLMVVACQRIAEKFNRTLF